MTIAWMDPNKITDITIHCAATPEGSPRTAEAITSYDVTRFGQPSYHYVITLDGVVHQTLRHDQRGAHTGGHNTGNIGICYVGGMDAKMKAPKDTRTPAQLAAMASLVKRLRAQYPRARVLGHRDWPGVNKACPCFDVKSWLPTIGA